MGRVAADLRPGAPRPTAPRWRCGPRSSANLGPRLGAGFTAPFTEELPRRPAWSCSSCSPRARAVRVRRLHPRRLHRPRLPGLRGRPLRRQLGVRSRSDPPRRPRPSRPSRARSITGIVTHTLYSRDLLRGSGVVHRSAGRTGPTVARTAADAPRPSPAWGARRRPGVRRRRLPRQHPCRDRRDHPGHHRVQDRLQARAQLDARPARPGSGAGDHHPTRARRHGRQPQGPPALRPLGPRPPQPRAGQARHPRCYGPGRRDRQGGRSGERGRRPRPRRVTRVRA